MCTRCVCTYSASPLLVWLPEYDREISFPKPSSSLTCVQGLFPNKRREGFSRRVCRHDFFREAKIGVPLLHTYLGFLTLPTVAPLFFSYLRDPGKGDTLLSLYPFGSLSVIIFIGRTFKQVKILHALPPKLTRWSYITCISDIFYMMLVETKNPPHCLAPSCFLVPRQMLCLSVLVQSSAGNILSGCTHDMAKRVVGLSSFSAVALSYQSPPISLRHAKAVKKMLLEVTWTQGLTYLYDTHPADVMSLPLCIRSYDTSHSRGSRNSLILHSCPLFFDPHQA